MLESTRGIKMAYEEHGVGPAVVLLNGIPLTSKPWQQQIRPLVAAGFRVIIPELTCVEKIPTAQAVENRGDDVIRLLNYLGIGRAAVVGMAMGGDVAISLLERHPHRLAGTALVACPGFPSDDVEHLRRTERLVRIQPGIPTLVLGTERERDEASMQDSANSDRCLVDFLRGLRRARACRPAFRKVA